MTKFRKWIFVALASTAVGLGLGLPATAMAGEKTATVQEAIDFAPQSDHGGDGNALFWVNQPDGARGTKKVIIPFFQIQFVVDSKSSATGAGGAHAEMAMHLSGPTPEQMQAITDDVYQSFINDLKMAGLEVVSLDEAKGYNSYNDIMTASRPSGEIVKGMNQVTSAFFAPAGMNYYYLPTMLPELAGGGSMTVLSNTGIIRKEADLMAQSGAAVVGFRAVVDFATLSASNRRGLRALARNAKTKGEVGLVIRPVATQMFLLTPQAKATMIDPQNRMRLELQAPLALDSEAILASEDSRTDGQKSGEALGNAISFLAGVGMSKSKAFNVVVDKEIWQKDVSDALKGVAAAATGRLKAGL